MCVYFSFVHGMLCMSKWRYAYSCWDFLSTAGSKPKWIFPKQYPSIEIQHQAKSGQATQGPRQVQVSQFCGILSNMLTVWYNLKSDLYRCVFLYFYNTRDVLDVLLTTDTLYLQDHSFW